MVFFVINSSPTNEYPKQREKHGPSVSTIDVRRDKQTIKSSQPTSSSLGDKLSCCTGKKAAMASSSQDSELLPTYPEIMAFQEIESERSISSNGAAASATKPHLQ